MKRDNQIISMIQIRHAHQTASMLIRRYGREYLPVLLRLEEELKNAEKIDRILLSSVAELS